MKVFLDECLPKDLGRLLTPHPCKTVSEMGWSGTSNGKLLDLVETNGFEAFITVDQNLAVQNPNKGRKLVIVVLQTKSNRLVDLQPLAPAILKLLKSASIGVHVLN